MAFAFVLLTKGIFGGAEQRFARLFIYLDEKFQGKIYFFVLDSMKNKITELYPQCNKDRIITIGKAEGLGFMYNPTCPGSLKIDRTPIFMNLIKKTFPYHFFYFLRSKRAQFKFFKEIENKAKQFGITSFIGIFSGILPLCFYLKKRELRPGIVFSNMDSWFSNISPNSRKEWFKTYELFNYALENSDRVDFLSPFIFEGIQNLGVKITPEKISFTPCSFIDYSKCHIGIKEKFRIAFSGRLEKDKNPILFLEAAFSLAREYPEVEFHILGEGRLSETITEQLGKSGRTNIIFHGFHPNPPEILAETSVFVSIQTTNNYPSQSVLEAMACGNAIIASDVGDTRMFVSEKTGSLIHLSLDNLTKSLKWCIEHPAETLEKGIIGTKYVRENHSIERSADYYIRLFQQAEKAVIKN
jgi:glycosyltransferase involved in cell wall biosynthesis